MKYRQQRHTHKKRHTKKTKKKNNETIYRDASLLWARKCDLPLTNFVTFMFKLLGDNATFNTIFIYCIYPLACDILKFHFIQITYEFGYIYMIKSLRFAIRQTLSFLYKNPSRFCLSQSLFQSNSYK